MHRTLRYPGFWLAVGLVGIGVAVQMAVATPLELVDMFLRESGTQPWRLTRDPLMLGLMNILALGTAIGVGLFVNRLWPRAAFPLVGIASVAWIALALIGVGAGILLSEVDNVCRWLVPPPEFIVEMVADVFMPKGRFFSLFFTLVVVAPVTEELLFRGIILRGFLGRFKPWMAIFLSAMLFAVMHMNPWQTLPPFVLGVIFGWFYLRTGSLWPCIVGHALNNFLFLILTTAPFGLWLPSTAEDWRRVEFQPWWFDVLGAGLLLAGIWLFRKHSRDPVVASANVPPVIPPADLPPVITG